MHIKVFKSTFMFTGNNVGIVLHTNTMVQERVLSTLKDAGVFTSGGLVSDKVGHLLLMVSLVECSFGHQLEVEL